jgi:hypothetical protein
MSRKPLLALSPVGSSKAVSGYYSATEIITASVTITTLRNPSNVSCLIFWLALFRVVDEIRLAHVHHNLTLSPVVKSLKCTQAKLIGVPLNRDCGQGGW